MVWVSIHIISMALLPHVRIHMKIRLRFAHFSRRAHSIATNDTAHTFSFSFKCTVYIRISFAAMIYAMSLFMPAFLNV